MSVETSQPPTIVRLLQDLREESTTLLRQEVALAKAELRQNVSEYGQNTLALTIGALIAYAGFTVLLIGLGQLATVWLIRAGVGADMAPWVAPSVVGFLVALIGWGLFAKAKRALSCDALTPTRTIESLKTNKRWIQNKLQHSHESST
jgi:hypothetical protein